MQYPMVCVDLSEINEAIHIQLMYCKHHPHSTFSIIILYGYSILLWQQPSR